MKKVNLLVAVLALIFITKISYSQDIEQELAITTAVPILTIAPDSRAGGMGDIGAATTPDASSQHWNPAKYSFAKDDFGLSISYTPWLKQLIGDMNISYIAGFKHLGERQSVGVSLRYFSLGSITFTNMFGGVIMEDYKPNEFAIDGSYSLKLSDNLSGAVALRFIYSNLVAEGLSVPGAGNAHPGIAGAGDLAFFYTKDLNLKDKTGNISFGMDISNLGNKISYSDASQQNFLPANMRLGGAFSVNLDDYNKLLLAADINKLLVPTLKYGDVAYNDSINEIAVSTAIFTSFADAPYGFSEEMHEVMISVGAEYWYNERFAIRAGYFNENQNKGNRKYFTTGIGLRLNVFSLDFSYLISVSQRNPLEGTMRFTLGFNFEALSGK
jgi:hypothetical protein